MSCGLLVLLVLKTTQKVFKISSLNSRIWTSKEHITIWPLNNSKKYVISNFTLLKSLTPRTSHGSKITLMRLCHSSPKILNSTNLDMLNLQVISTHSRKECWQESQRDLPWLVLKIQSSSNKINTIKMSKISNSMRKIIHTHQISYSAIKDKKFC